MIRRKNAAASEPAPLVLVVDDEHQLRRFVCQMLRRTGYAVIDAPDGPAALALLESESRHVDLLFTDVNMPGMQGPALADIARRLRPDLKVLLTSGHAFADEPGIATYPLLQKPYRRAELAKAVAAALGLETGSDGRNQSRCASLASMAAPLPR